jgi:hypothetical protein
MSDLTATDMGDMGALLPQLSETQSCTAALSRFKPIALSSREVVPVGACSSSAAKCVDPRREELVRAPRPAHASHVPSPAQLPIGDDLVEARVAEGIVRRRESEALDEGSSD